MALANFSLPFGALAQPVQPWGATISPVHPVHQLATNTNNLLYSPADHQQQDDDSAPPPGSSYYKNNPYAPPQSHQESQQQPQSQRQQSSYQFNSNSNGRPKSGNAYLPPIATAAARGTQYHQQQHQQHQQQQQQQPFSHLNAGQQQQIHSNSLAYNAASSAAATTATATRIYGEGSYNRFAGAGAFASEERTQAQHPPQPQQQQYFKAYSATQTRSSSSNSVSSQFNSQQAATQANSQAQLQQNQKNSGAKLEAPTTIYGAAAGNAGSNNGDVNIKGNSNSDGGYPERPPGFTQVQAGQGSRTQVHAVLDYDVEEGEEDYYDDTDNGEPVNKDGSNKSSMPTVTPIQGPIFLKNGTVPVVPLFSYPTINNGSFVQIPIWWTALSVALGLDVRGDVIKGVPCIKRYHQLFCPTAGNRYPIDKIERFIDDNKALMRRMYGDFEMNMDPGGPRQQLKKRKRRFIDEPDIFIPPGGVHPAIIPEDGHAPPHSEEAGESYFGKLRQKRQTGGQNRNNNNKGTPKFSQNGPGGANAGSSTGRLDACESKVEIVTPYWASNSAGKIRAIVNTQHFEQAIHQEVCSKAQTGRCEGDCGCEQKYKWHRLLAYDPDNDCKGIFMDWFLFPSCCVCRCNP